VAVNPNAVQAPITFSTVTTPNGTLVNPFNAVVPLVTAVPTRTVNGADAPVPYSYATGSGIDSSDKHKALESTRLKAA